MTFYELCNRLKWVPSTGGFFAAHSRYQRIQQYRQKGLEEFLLQPFTHYATFLLFERDDLSPDFELLPSPGFRFSTPFPSSGASTIFHSAPLFHGPTASVSPSSPTPVESLKYSSTNPGVGGILPMVKRSFPMLSNAAVKAFMWVISRVIKN